VTSEKENAMRVFVAGASGAIGTRLVPQLIERGHEVIGTSRSPEKAERLRTLGAKPIALDLLDARAVRKAVLEASPRRLFTRRPRWRIFASPGTSIAPSRRPTGFAPKAPTPSLPPRARLVCAGS
jgi:NAD(P)-dependent dehydrogenase (short-subunit alcohol dehydrogenase family)